MSTYARRRLLAAVAVVLIAGVLIAGAASLLGGGGEKPAAEPAHRRRDALGGQSAPIAPSSLPTRRAASRRRPAIRGDGPFWQLAGTIVQRIAPPYRKGRVALTFDDGPGPYTRRCWPSCSRCTRAPRSS